MLLLEKRAVDAGKMMETLQNMKVAVHAKDVEETDPVPAL